MTMNLGMNAANIYAYNTLNNLDTPIYGYNSGAMSMGGSIMPGFMNNPQQQMAQMDQWNKYNVESQVKQYQLQQAGQIQMYAQEDVISRQIGILNSKVKGNKQNEIAGEYDKLVQAVKQTYGSSMTGLSKDAIELQCKAYAEKLYAQQTGMMLTDDIKANGSSSFWQGIKQAFSFGLGNRKTAAQNIAKIEGTNLSGGEKTKKVFGNIVGTLLGGGIAVCSLFIGKAIKG